MTRLGRWFKQDRYYTLAEQTCRVIIAFLIALILAVIAVGIVYHAFWPLIGEWPVKR